MNTKYLLALFFAVAMVFTAMQPVALACGGNGEDKTEHSSPTE